MLYEVITEDMTHGGGLFGGKRPAGLGSREGGFGHRVPGLASPCLGRSGHGALKLHHLARGIPYLPGGGAQAHKLGVRLESVHGILDARGIELSLRFLV